MSETTETKTTKVKKPPVYNIVVDCGNRNIKAAMFKGSELVVVKLPSWVKKTEDCNHVIGGFRFEGGAKENKCGWVVGEAVEGKPEAIQIVEHDTGKITFLPHMIAAALQAFHQRVGLKQGAVIRLHVLTLQESRTQDIAKAIEQVSHMSINDTPMQFKPELAGIYPEGIGCAVAAFQAFKQDNPLVVGILDIGGGTLNFGVYERGRAVGKKQTLPCKLQMHFKPAGIEPLEAMIADELAKDSSNGKRRPELVREALETNSYIIQNTYLAESQEATIRKVVEQWTHTADFQFIMRKVANMLRTGGHVSVCGGGFMVRVVRETVIETLQMILMDDPDKLKNFHVPASTELLSVTGLLSMVSQPTQPRKQKQKETNSNDGTNESLETTKHNSAVGFQHDRGAEVSEREGADNKPDGEHTTGGTPEAIGTPEVETTTDQLKTEVQEVA